MSPRVREKIAPLLIALSLLVTWSGQAGTPESEAIGVLQGISRDLPAIWRIDDRNYVFTPETTIRVAGSSSPGGAADARVGQLVRVSYEERDGVRRAGTIQLMGTTPASIQDGPHLVWTGADSATMITIVDGQVIRSAHEGLTEGVVIPTPSRTVPEIRIAGTVTPPRSSWPDAVRVLAVSDLEGNRETFLEFLRGNGVVDDSGSWTWGDGHLVLNGDIVDRGAEVTELLWSIRRLASEAIESGGRVHYILGNHESMIMAGDLRYIHPKYRFSTDRIGISYDRLHGPESELGRWLRSHNSVERIGPLLFVHAGYSPQLDRLGLDLEEINHAIRSGLGPPAWPAEAREDLRTGLIWHSQGPHWFRGYFPKHAEDWGGRPTDAEITSILDRHEVRHVVVGHTVVDDVGWIDDRSELIGIDVAWRDPSEAAGLLLDEGRLFRVDAAGSRSPLIPPTALPGG